MSSIFDEGTGSPIVVIPGVQGRWEWMAPALKALSSRCRTISYSLAHATKLDDLVAQLDAVLDARGLSSAVVCGVSYGGLVALRYAAQRPARTRGLVIVSTPSPSWKPSPRQARYLSRPWLSTPAFIATSPMRMWPEIRAAFDSVADSVTFAVSHAARIVGAPIVPAAMAARMRLLDGHDFRADSARVTSPTLIVSGEEGLDLVVPVQSTCEYTRLIAGARYERMNRTGHIGLVTRADLFATVVGNFVNADHS